MKLIHRHYKHVSGTKDYDTWYIARDDGSAMLIKRWGKVGVSGSLQRVVGSQGELLKELGKVDKSRKNSSYATPELTTVDFDEIHESLKKEFGFAYKRYHKFINEFVGTPVNVGETFIPKQQAQEEAIRRSPPEDRYSTWGSF